MVRKTKTNKTNAMKCKLCHKKMQLRILSIKEYIYTHNVCGYSYYKSTKKEYIDYEFLELEYNHTTKKLIISNNSFDDINPYTIYLQVNINRFTSKIARKYLQKMKLIQLML